LHRLRCICSTTPAAASGHIRCAWLTHPVQPILVAAAVDYEITNGTRFGGLGREVRERIFARRRQLLGLEAWGTQPSGPGASPSDPPAQAQLLQHTPFALTPQAALQRELDGGIILVGRPAYKEYMWGLQQGWSRALPPRREDTDEPLARLLAEDSAFDEVVPKKEDGEELFGDAVPGEDAASRAAAAAASVADDEWQGEADGAGAPLPSRLGKGSLGVSSYLSSPVSPAGRKPPPAEAAPSVAPELLAPPAQIPAQPPLVFADYVNLVGLRYMPRRLVGFFNERAKVRAGGEVALQLALGTVQTAREFDAPAQPRDGPPPQGGDLDWGLRSDDFILPRFRKTQKLVEKQRKEFYDGLPRRLQDTRSLVRGEREATKMETNDPPKSEAELREERFRKEREWRNTLEAYEVLRTEQGVAWSEAFRGALRVFERPAAGEELRQ
jgi:import inner membrane translocase subunit TIM54